MVNLKNIKKLLLEHHKNNPFLTLYEVQCFIRSILPIPKYKRQFYCDYSRIDNCIHITRINCLRFFAILFKVLCITLSNDGDLLIVYHRMYKHYEYYNKMKG